ncbi:MAG: hypothetical protein WAL25_12455 [Acidimicrobiia bacterium]
MSLYRFVCDHVVPGCTHQDEDESRPALELRANEHLMQHHSRDQVDDWIAEANVPAELTFLRPA